MMFRLCSLSSDSFVKLIDYTSYCNNDHKQINYKLMMPFQYTLVIVLQKKMQYQLQLQKLMVDYRLGSFLPQIIRTQSHTHTYEQCVQIEKLIIHVQGEDYTRCNNIIQLIIEGNQSQGNLSFGLHQMLLISLLLHKPNMVIGLFNPYICLII